MSSIENQHHERPADSAAATRFADLWEENVGRVHRYVSRHAEPHTADDVVAETFLVAWRRIDDVPEDSLPWLLVVARNTVANARRSTYRRRAVEIELARVAHLAAHAPTPGVIVPEREHVLAALARLSPKSREIVLLLAWDGLDTSQAAQVLGTSQAAVKMRLSRARRQLTRELDDQKDPTADKPQCVPDPTTMPPAFTTSDIRSAR
ncbi:RNA polymerase sigma factor [Oerskovia jenensis]|uniref:RNA polymerase sigma factor n=1 Tax=Oerskovia jenensis TaxID=162169 RepID=UPI0036D7FC43